MEKEGFLPNTLSKEECSILSDIETLSDPDYVAGKGLPLCTIIKNELPHLKVVQGIVYSHENPDNFNENLQEYGHAWLETPNGSILDPTAAQFHLLGSLTYEKKEHLPTGRCWICGKARFTEAPHCDNQVCIEDSYSM